MFIDMPSGCDNEEDAAYYVLHVTISDVTFNALTISAKGMAKVQKYEIEKKVICICYLFFLYIFHHD